MESPENVQNIDSSSHHSKSTEDDIVILNIGHYEGYKSESLIIMRVGNDSHSEAVNTIKNARKYIRQPAKSDEIQQSSLEIENRVECLKMEGYENIPDGLYLLYRLQEKINENNGEAYSVNVINEDSAHGSPTSNLTSLNTSERESKNKNAFRRMINILDNLKSPSGFSFENIKSLLRTNGLELNSKQLNALLYRAVKKNILERIPGGVRSYKFKI